MSENLNLDLPVGELALMPLMGMENFTRKLDSYISSWRVERNSNIKNDNPLYKNYFKESYINMPKLSRFGTGEAKCTLLESVRGVDAYLIVDVTNHSCTYKMFGEENRMSPDDHFQDLKRVIAAINGKAKRINVIMTFLYESRQHKRTKRESLDCSLMLHELESMGVSNIITFDAHDPRVMNAIPLSSFDSISCTYQFIQSLLNSKDDFIIDSDHMMIISPDSGAMQRSIYLASVLGIDVGMFYKRRDYSVVIDGKNPIVAHEFLGSNVKGKDVIIVDDMISSGDSLLETAKVLKDMQAKRVFAICTFGLFTNGFNKFDEAYEKGEIEGILTTNSIYQKEELFSKPWYISVDVTEYLARIIDSLNHDASISAYLDPNEKIHNFVKEYVERKINKIWINNV
ncbi:MAG: ribose-phosphate pyrophosphokinase [Eubacteriales bacterium]|nr:ribose-phosphate pyrophosphokinase [Eubacteriales bacterium]